MKNDINNSVKITIVIPVYNTEEYIEDCVNTIINQSYNNLEIILINDGSTDNSLEICVNLSKIDKRIIVINKPNGGVSSARNSGIRIASGEYLAFIDSDDKVDVDIIRVLYDGIISTNSDLSICGISTYSQRNPPKLNQVGSKNILIDNEYAIERLLYHRNLSVSVSGKLYPRRLFDSNMFNEDISFGEDLDFNYRIFSNIDLISVNSNIMYYYFVHETSTMNSEFSSKRLDGLIVVEGINYDINLNRPNLNKASEFKCFYEALTIIWQIPFFNNKYKDEKNHCKRTIRRLSNKVVLDKYAGKKNRIYALSALVDIKLLILYFKFKSKIQGLSR
jgi:glycosyltransferase involved in cell wall biosynthesis